MGDSSSDSEEFYDAEEFTPIKGHKRSSIKSIGVNEIESKGKLSPSKLSHPHTSNEFKEKEESQKKSDENINIHHVVQDRRRFEELRRCMQDEDDDETELASELPTYTMEHPFKIIANDTMSLQSTTSLGRIGRILSGAAESHPNITENKSPNIVVSDPRDREPSTKSDDQILLDRPQNVLAMAEPDVIASTKANSLKSRGGVSVTMATLNQYAQPVAPPRRKKRNKMYGSQSLSTTDGDNLSVCTNDTDEYLNMGRKNERTEKPPPLDGLLNEQRLLSAGLIPSMALPSPASTIESLTREFQDSLNLSQNKYDFRPQVEQSSSSSRSSTGKSMKSQKPNRSTSDDREEYQYRIERGTGRTHSDTRPSNSGNASRSSRNDSESSDRRRRSAGDDVLAGNRTDKLTDEQILEKVTVLNLDTGERMPLSIAEQKIPQCINPLSLHIMRLTSEYRQNEEDNARETDEESESVCAAADDDIKDNKQENTDKQTSVAIKKKTEKLKRFFGSTMKRTVDAAKSLAQEVTQHRHKEDVSDIVDEVRGEHNVKLKASHSHKGPYDFDGCVRYVQELQGGGNGAVWCCKWSWCGRLLATAGQDKLLRVWVTVDASPTLHAMRSQFTPITTLPESTYASAKCAPFEQKPFAIYEGHSSDLLDLAWSKNYFLLSSSMDKTVRLWHISQAECLCCFQHIDFVTAIAFHPRDDRYFLSGSLDGKLRLWDIPDKKVAVWNEVDGKTKLITAANFCQNGKFAVVGTYDGRCIFYTTDQLKYHTQIDVRSTRGKNSTGRKISGIEPMPNDDKILVTSNDSRIRLYDLRDLNLSCKYKGYVNISSQIKASFSHDGKYIVCGSENQCIYIWKTCHDYAKFTSVRRDRNDFWEGIKAHNALVTCAVFAPNPDHLIRMITEREEQAKAAEGHNDSVDNVKSPESSMVSSSQTGHVLVSADFNGCIKVFLHKAKPKHSSLPASALA